jgi:hypothetical protein
VSNLSDIFGPPAAGGGLAGRLTPVTPAAVPANPPAVPAAIPQAPTPANPVATPVAAPVADPPAPPPAAPIADPKATSPASSNADDETTRQITVYVLPHIPELLRSSKQGRTNAAVVYDAIEAAQHGIPALLAARQATPDPGTGGLFARHSGDQRGEAGRVPWTFKTTPSNRQVLDQLVKKYRAASRSELVSTVLEHAFPPPPDTDGPARRDGAAGAGHTTAADPAQHPTRPRQGHAAPGAVRR